MQSYQLQKAEGEEAKRKEIYFCEYKHFVMICFFCCHQKEMLLTRGVVGNVGGGLVGLLVVGVGSLLVLGSPDG